ncbi:hypothetical protein SERLA73DRAFT_146052 [Serpula lacrymans var. lacrymans S7.3]|uniref:Uncharacterized protein n=2 Tax=Serpula lacrymans var. lacrymans TaxID=341189 RepID=F8QF04_SERL3|nr:uncharacterized protein SERLADRAFT_376633 [Serpula lacrymans var. lacrymans S7.9]EGN93167.1 hypothetical protein SERLA73DRAFT_146052 [Serpula lacrymans var. lacrymans S7.3]EGO31063.1 hypothetical protein SERLADRAFT_376633 [Serpula lacrymans var. lacrymans S7.9]
MGTILSKYAAVSAHFLCRAETDAGAGSKKSNAAADGEKNVKRGPKDCPKAKISLLERPINRLHTYYQ